MDMSFGYMLRLVRSSLILIAVIFLQSTETSFARAYKLQEFSTPNAHLTWLVDEEVLRRQPKWDPEKGLLPLTIQTATEIARRHLLSTVAKNSTIEVDAIELRSISSDGLPKVWYYIISFGWSGDTQVNMTPPSAVIILMDGHIVQPHSN